MGVYREFVLPRLIDRLCGSRAMVRWRERVTEGLVGQVVEIGFGSGLNLEFLPPEVTGVFAVEPSATAMKLALKREADVSVRVVHVGLDGGSIALADESCDSALCTFTLCTVADPTKVLGEIHRVLRPGASLHFLEHGIAPDPSVARWQRRLDPWEQRLADGCHLTRDPRSLVRDAGFTIESIEQRYARGPKPWSYFTLGRATKR
jgi:ubiquinone/menaquinone biosynthesis C-methylase UbiE